MKFLLETEGDLESASDAGLSCRECGLSGRCMSDAPKRAGDEQREAGNGVSDYELTCAASVPLPKSSTGMGGL
jgi:hypothetical protein